MRTKLICSFLAGMFSLSASPFAEGATRGKTLSNGVLSVRWERQAEGWRLVAVSAFGRPLGVAESQHTVLFSGEKPSDRPLTAGEVGVDENFPGEEYRYVMPSWNEATTAVALNRAGEEISFLPASVTSLADSAARLDYRCASFSLSETWSLDGKDIRVSMSLTARRDGWYSMATPSVASFSPERLDFALIPGVLHGHELSADFARAYAYGWGIPSVPVLFRERSTSTLTSIASDKDGLSVAVTAMPGTAAEPWGDDRRNTGLWRLGLSAMNRRGELAPTLYHPVLGQDGSYMKAGETRTFGFVFSFDSRGWWPLFLHAARDIYDFGQSLGLRRNRRSLTDRLYGIHRYVVNDSTSKWHTVVFEGDTIGAQEYLGGVYMAKKDAMKNADYGAMWMLGSLTGDTLLTRKRLPYALNFKLRQQHCGEGPMSGASRGQYYLSAGKRFVEEWGPYTEPVATTYYMLMDLGNIALFEPDNQDVRDRIRLAAEWLLDNQKEDGSWTVAYSDADGSEAFDDLRDYRPTFYGLLIAWKVLGDNRYLEAARRGADWIIANAVEPHRWLGVCGDTRFAPDFATAQAAQALMEMYDATGAGRYLDAAVSTARFYATSVYTNPVASRRPVSVKGRPLEQWQITTAGLAYEHGGIIGSANLHGPVLLASHAGMFVRMYRLTGEEIFLEMARAAAIGRDAFVDDETAVATYYWAAMNRGAGPYPHHAWWQMGWMTDYLMAELELRSEGRIRFPAGFITPKVGPHRTYGFAEGTVYGDKASLAMMPGEFKVADPDVEMVSARGEGHIYIMLLNDTAEPKTVALESRTYGVRKIQLASYGLETIKIPVEK